VSEAIGFRSIATRGADILLNGQADFLARHLDPRASAERPGRATSEADARKLLGWAKELGCNFVRLAHYPHNEHMVRVAEELGLLVWSGSTRLLDHPVAEPRDVRQRRAPGH
jgi:beta-glucuronidase